MVRLIRSAPSKSKLRTAAVLKAVVNMDQLNTIHRHPEQLNIIFFSFSLTLNNRSCLTSLNNNVFGIQSNLFIAISAITDSCFN